ncbi:MAG TPA: DUF4180 domain-containing protein [Ignavibacteriaceae bacterium]|nr:DUF4180 domain-containing protein [Ignavibacteriaceae bacterium]
MDVVIHNLNENKIAEIISDEIIINNLQDALDLIANISYQEINKIILKENNITSDFYKLKTGLLGEILQKCVNYNIQIAIVGNFEKYKSKSLRAFIIESNKGNQFFFVSDISKAKQMLIKTYK